MGSEHAIQWMPVKEVAKLENKGLGRIHNLAAYSGAKQPAIPIHSSR